MKCLTKLFVFCQEKSDYIPIDKCEECKCYKHICREEHYLVVECDYENEDKNKK